MAIPFEVFIFVAKYEGMTVRASRSVREELLAMGSVVPLLFYDAKASFAHAAFGTDAMGSNDTDHGGYGVVAREVDLDLIRNALEAGGSPGFTIARLSGDMSGSKFPNKRITATKPFSLLDPTWFDESKWKRISKGRWKYSDTVVLGESRAVNRLIGILSVF